MTRIDLLNSAICGTLWTLSLVSCAQGPSGYRQQNDAVYAPFMASLDGPLAPRFVGRFEKRSGGGRRFAWSGSAMSVAFRGTSLAVELTDTGKNRFMVLLDGKPQRVVTPPAGQSVTNLFLDLPRAEHVVTLYKLTEPLVGITELHRFVLDEKGSWLSTPAAPSRRLEIIGDSISTGYGNEGDGPNCPFSPETQNHFHSYGAIAARALEADLVTLAWSGRGVFSNRGSKTETATMSELWEKTIPEDAHGDWSFDEEQPHAVVINLGSNDFAPEVEDTSPFASAYEKLLANVRARRPLAHVFAAVGPLLRDSDPPRRLELSTVRATLQELVQRRRAGGDDHIHYLEHEPTRESEGWGCDYHPSKQTHLRMASELESALRKVLPWGND